METDIELNMGEHAGTIGDSAAGVAWHPDAGHQQGLNASTELLPPYAGDAAEFFDTMLSPGTNGVVAAETGGGKTLFLCNLMAYALMDNQRLGIVCLDMPWKKIVLRLLSMLADVPANDRDALVARFHSPAADDPVAPAVHQMIRTVTRR